MKLYCNCLMFSENLKWRLIGKRVLWTKASGWIGRCLFYILSLPLFNFQLNWNSHCEMRNLRMRGFKECSCAHQITPTSSSAVKSIALKVLTTTFQTWHAYFKSIPLLLVAVNEFKILKDAIYGAYSICIFQFSKSM